MALMVTESRFHKPLGISSNNRLIFSQGYILQTNKQTYPNQILDHFHRAWILNCSSHNMHRSSRSSSSYSKDRWARQHWRRSFVPVTQSHFFARSNLNGVRYVICFKSSSPKWQPLSQPSLFPKFQPCPTGQKWQQAWVTSTKRKGMWRVYVNHYQLLGKSACLVQGWKKS